MQYRRFRHFGKDKVTMDFAFFAIAFNIKKLCASLLKSGIKLEFTTIVSIDNLVRMAWKVYNENQTNLAA